MKKKEIIIILILLIILVIAVVLSKVLPSYKAIEKMKVIEEINNAEKYISLTYYYNGPSLGLLGDTSEPFHIETYEITTNGWVVNLYEKLGEISQEKKQNVRDYILSNIKQYEVERESFYTLIIDGNRYEIDENGFETFKEYILSLVR